MRLEGTLSKWNDDRGFGFIAPAPSGKEVFAHISAFPQDGQRPRQGERLSFEIEAAADGKQRAKEIRYLDRPAPSVRRPRQSGRPRSTRSSLPRAIPLLIVVALGTYWYTARPRHSAAPATVTAPPAEELVEQASSRFQCDGRTHCSEMRSCAEARFFLDNCPNVEMDGDDDGEPCERQWC